MNKEERRVVRLEWLDSCGDRGWNSADPEEDKRQMLIVSIGFVVYETKDVIAISTSVNVNNKFMDILAIPKLAITKRSCAALARQKRRKGK